MQATTQAIVELPLQPKKEFAPQLATSAPSNFPSGSKYHKRHVPKYTTPFPSPTTSQPSSPVVRNDKKPASHNNPPLLSSASKQVKEQIYDLDKMAGAIANNNNTGVEGSGRMFKRRSEGWWNCLSLPTSNHNSLVGTYAAVAISVSSSGDPSVAHEVSLPNLTLSTSIVSTNNLNTTLSPRIASPTNISPLSASKNRTAR